SKPYPAILIYEKACPVGSWRQKLHSHSRSLVGNIALRRDAITINSKGFKLFVLKAKQPEIVGLPTDLMPSSPAIDRNARTRSRINRTIRRRHTYCSGRRNRSDIVHKRPYVFRIQYRFKTGHGLPTVLQLLAMHDRPEDFAVTAIRKQGCCQIGWPYRIARCLLTASAPVIAMTGGTIASESRSTPRNCNRPIGCGRAQKTCFIGLLNKQSDAR